MLVNVIVMNNLNDVIMKYQYQVFIVMNNICMHEYVFTIVIKLINISILYIYPMIFLYLRYISGVKFL